MKQSNYDSVAASRAGSDGSRLAFNIPGPFTFPIVTNKVLDH